VAAETSGSETYYTYNGKHYASLEAVNMAAAGRMPMASQDSTETPSPGASWAGVTAPQPEVYRYNGKVYASLGEVNEAIFADTGVRPMSSVAEVQASAAAAVTPAVAANVPPAKSANEAPVPTADVLPDVPANTPFSPDNAAPAVAANVPQVSNSPFTAANVPPATAADVLPTEEPEPEEKPEENATAALVN
jgi:hypothetical protein